MKIKTENVKFTSRLNANFQPRVSLTDFRHFDPFPVADVFAGKTENDFDRIL